MNSEGWAVPMRGTATQLQFPPAQRLAPGTKTRHCNAIEAPRTGSVRRLSRGTEAREAANMAASPTSAMTR